MMVKTVVLIVGFYFCIC